MEGKMQESPTQEEIVDFEIQVSLTDIAGKTFEFGKLGELYQFLKKELAFWENHCDSTEEKREVQNCRLNPYDQTDIFKGNVDNIEDLINNPNWDIDPTVSDSFDAFYNLILRRLNRIFLWSAHSFTDRYIELFKEGNYDLAQVFLDASTSNYATDQWRLDAREQYDKAQKDRRDKFSQLIGDLEKKYGEKLRLAKPAKYWHEAAKKYGIQGIIWMLLLSLFIFLGLYYLSEFFNNWLLGKEIGVRLNTLKGVLLFGTGIAVFVFLIKTVSRLTFTSFHLMRDAQEREQLTYLYLSLTNENKIDAESRSLVLQPLFSRNDSGLINTKSETSMYTPLIKEVIKGSSNK